MNHDPLEAASQVLCVGEDVKDALAEFGLSVVDGEYLVVVQVWNKFATLHAHEEARLEFVRINVNKDDFYGSLNCRRESYVGIVDQDTWDRVQDGVEVRVSPSQAPMKWTLREKP